VRELDDDEVVCPGCGKIKAIVRGRISNHQKGLGTACPGAGKLAPTRDDEDEGEDEEAADDDE
jgi:hypothetical protein